MFGKTHFGILAASAVAGLAMLSTGNVQANMILNGNFSANASSYTVFPGYSNGSNPNPSSPADWTVSGAGSGVNGPDAGSAVGTPFAPASTTGVIDFNFMQNPGTWSYQAVNTTANSVYTLAFAAAQRDTDTNAVLEVIVTNANNGNQVTTMTPTINDTGFSNFSFNFTAASASTGIEFLNNTTATGDNTVDVSNVSLNPVPEPATLCMVAMGGLGLLLVGRKRTVRRNA